MLKSTLPCPLPDAIGDPHRFRVGDTEVEVLFDDSAPSLQACLTGMCRQLQ